MYVHARVHGRSRCTLTNHRHQELTACSIASPACRCWVSCIQCPVRACALSYVCTQIECYPSPSPSPRPFVVSFCDRITSHHITSHLITSHLTVSMSRSTSSSSSWSEEQRRAVDTIQQLVQQCTAGNEQKRQQRSTAQHSTSARANHMQRT